MPEKRDNFPKTGESGEESFDQKKALFYFEQNLRGEQLIEIPQNPGCEIGVVVPAYGESPERILAQVFSLVGQKGVPPEQFEVIYIVNNGKDDGSKNFKEIFELNQAVLQLPIWKNRDNLEFLKSFPEEKRDFLRTIHERFNFFAVDKSSPESSISDCNIGKARNRGAAEECKRFYEAGKNGILMQTDADVLFDYEQYLEKAVFLFRSAPTLIGVSGSVDYEFSPDNKEELEPEEIKKEWQDLVLLKASKRMSQFLQGQNKVEAHDFIGFGGANTLSRSFETAVFGNMADRAAGEDTDFSRRIDNFARGRGKKILGLQDSFILVSALRESGRTPVALKKFYGVTESGDKLVENLLAPSFDWFRQSSPEYKNMNRDLVWKVYEEKYPPMPLRELYKKLIEECGKTEAGQKLLRGLYEKIPRQFRDPTGENDFSFLKEI